MHMTVKMTGTKYTVIVKVTACKKKNYIARTIKKVKVTIKIS